MKKILYLTFYFEPDLCAGSFRNSPLVAELAKQAQGKATIDVISTLPNRYGTFDVEAPQSEERGNINITRIAIPKHQSGMKDQVFSFKEYYTQVKKLVKGKKYDLVVASSSRLFTAYLGYTVAKSLKAPLYLDIRDIFYDTLEDVLEEGFVKKAALPVIKMIERKTFRYASHINLISGGFKPYFQQYNKATYSYFPNGIDDVFIDANRNVDLCSTARKVKQIVYAGNLGEGQGLHKIVPLVAKALEAEIEFLIIGDGGAKAKLEAELARLNVTNVRLQNPVKRNELIAIYKQADYLFVHLNDYEAFKKVLPSKFFELATFPQPIIAGVGGFAANFVNENLENAILFEPCNADQLIEQLKNYNYERSVRNSFVERFKRDSVNEDMAATMLKYL